MTKRRILLRVRPLFRRKLNTLVVRHAAAAGPTARVEVSVQGIVPLIEAQLSRKRHLELGLEVGQQVAIAARAARVFPASASPGLSGSSVSG